MYYLKRNLLTILTVSMIVMAGCSHVIGSDPFSTSSQASPMSVSARSVGMFSAGVGEELFILDILFNTPATKAGYYFLTLNSPIGTLSGVDTGVIGVDGVFKPDTSIYPVTVDSSDNSILLNYNLGVGEKPLNMRVQYIVPIGWIPPNDAKLGTLVSLVNIETTQPKAITASPIYVVNTSSLLDNGGVTGTKVLPRSQKLNIDVSGVSHGTYEAYFNNSTNKLTLRLNVSGNSVGGSTNTVSSQEHIWDFEVVKSGLTMYTNSTCTNALAGTYSLVWLWGGPNNVPKPTKLDVNSISYSFIIRESDGKIVDTSQINRSYYALKDSLGTGSPASNLSVFQILPRIKNDGTLDSSYVTSMWVTWKEWLR